LPFLWCFHRGLSCGGPVAPRLREQQGPYQGRSSNAAMPQAPSRASGQRVTRENGEIGVSLALRVRWQFADRGTRSLQTAREQEPSGSGTCSHIPRHTK
jgi:hypothetical protein